MRIVNIIGTRPQYIKLGAMSLEFTGHDVLNIDTGQHYDSNMSAEFIKEFGLKIDRVTMDIVEIRKEIRKFGPDVVLLYGDTHSTLLGLIASEGYIRGHVEAGVRTFNRSYTEENIRMAVDHASDFCFCPSDVGCKNLIKEGKDRGRIFDTGDVMVDTIKLSNIGIIEDDYIFMTLHRPQNVDNPFSLQTIMDEVGKCDIKVIFPVHPRTMKIINKHNIKIPFNIRYVEPMSYHDSLQHISNAVCTITDSGGVEKETYSLKTPGVIIRDDTPWPETHDCGWNKLSSINEISYIVNNMVRKRTPFDWVPWYGDGNARKKIMEILDENINS